MMEPVINRFHNPVEKNLPGQTSQHDANQLPHAAGGRLFHSDRPLPVFNPLREEQAEPSAESLEAERNALTNLLLTVEIARYPNFLVNGFHALTLPLADLQPLSAAPPQTHPKAAFLKPFQSRDLKVLQALFERDDIDDITDNIHTRLAQLCPEPCWEEHPYDFLREFL